MTYDDGSLITTPELSFSITRQDFRPTQIIVRSQRPVTSIEIGRNIDIHSPEVQIAIGKFLVRTARRFAPDILLPQAREISTRLGLTPESWRISTGRRILGSCTGSRVISLSCVCVFLPPHLREYIICHELAHLREMNHSATFHAVCNGFCDGREKELIAELKRFEWPLPKKVDF